MANGILTRDCRERLGAFPRVVRVPALGACPSGAMQRRPRVGESGTSCRTWGLGGPLPDARNRQKWGHGAELPDPVLGLLPTDLRCICHCVWARKLHPDRSRVERPCGPAVAASSAGQPSSPVDGLTPEVAPVITRLRRQMLVRPVRGDGADTASVAVPR